MIVYARRHQGRPTLADGPRHPYGSQTALRAFDPPLSTCHQNPNHSGNRKGIHLISKVLGSIRNRFRPALHTPSYHLMSPFLAFYFPPTLQLLSSHRCTHVLARDRLRRHLLTATKLSQLKAWVMWRQAIDRSQRDKACGPGLLVFPCPVTRTLQPHPPAP